MFGGMGALGTGMSSYNSSTNPPTRPRTPPSPRTQHVSWMDRKAREHWREDAWEIRRKHKRRRKKEVKKEVRRRCEEDLLEHRHKYALKAHLVMQKEPPEVRDAGRSPDHWEKHGRLDTSVPHRLGSMLRKSETRRFSETAMTPPGRPSTPFQKIMSPIPIIDSVPAPNEPLFRTEDTSRPATPTSESDAVA
ncbi:uncharacterized protein BCR38DRAFT_487983 [Pseudomassariella vexata]|uniref:Uncharacterized protein n=1 Tax=Pseudomassariella vexata TaxID=1141098 RepID=A0A1Y2DP72_9PEZI|nr:uncharacterized protein BCR38DRAFT_487983 [Pseudomassariella vexata]ORY60926.1 hypothetical protein BCR38DRAFT_487983 [Pseudomassariella vexata]